nr:glycosyltransferase [Motilibacter deserti]
MVCHDGESWLPTTLAALRRLRLRPDRLVVVDAGSADGTRALLDAAVARGELDRVVDAPRTSGFGASVAAGLAALGPAVSGDDAPGWVWLLHDDAAPRPDALRALLAAAAAAPDAPVLGPKLLDWRSPRRLLEVGVTIAGSGRLETGLDRAEVDQGQRDGLRDVLAVNTAGMLVRADVWQELGGLEPSLPLFRDDVDFGWRARAAGHRVVCATDSVLVHAAAARRGWRRPAAVRGSAPRADRRAALRVLLLNGAGWALPLLLLRLGAGTLLRVCTLLLGRDPRGAAAEALALPAALAAPGALLRGRSRRRRTRRVGSRSVRPFLARPGSALRHLRDAAAAALGPASPGAPDPTDSLETGPVAEAVEELPVGRPSLLHRLLVRPSTLLVLALGLLTLLATRRLVGSGSLAGGALLPAPEGASDLLSAAGAGWHAVGVGSGAQAPAYLVPLGLLAGLLGGRAPLAVDVLLLGAVPLAALTAYVALRPVVSSRAVRCWAVAAYALLPAAPGAVATGRVGTAATLVLLPLLARAGAAALGRGRTAWRACWAAGLLLAVASAFVPVLWPLAAVLAVGGVGAAARHGVRPALATAARALVLLGLPAALLAPEAARLVDEPRRLAAETGLTAPGLSVPGLDPLAVVLLHPGGPGSYPLAFTLPLLLAALGAVLVARWSPRPGLVAAGWAVALAGMAAGVLVARTPLPTGSGPAGTVAGWPGPATLVAGAGLVLAAAAGAEGASIRLRERSFGWRQPTAVVLAAVAALAPLVVAARWVSVGVPKPVERTASVVPAFVAAEAAGPERARTLVLSGGLSSVSYLLDRGTGARLGDAETPASAQAQAALSAAVADVASGRGGTAAAALPAFGARYVLLQAPVDPALARALDTVPGLRRTGEQQPNALWEVEVATAPATPLRLVGRRGAEPLPSTPRGAGATATLPAGEPGRVLVLTEPRDAGWRATLDGQALQAAPGPAGATWAQAFALPAGGGALSVTHEDDARSRGDAGRIGLAAVALLLTLPSARRRTGAAEAVPEAVRA